MSRLLWRKSSHSPSDTGQCAEVASTGPAITVRDSKNPAGPRLSVDSADWQGFLAGLRQLSRLHWSATFAAASRYSSSLGTTSAVWSAIFAITMNWILMSSGIGI